MSFCIIRKLYFCRECRRVAVRNFRLSLIHKVALMGSTAPAASARTHWSSRALGMGLQQYLGEAKHHRHAYMIAASAAMGSVFYGWDIGLIGGVLALPRAVHRTRKRVRP
ncbi:hypothetical protein BC835DRAFT_1305425 [Cytidiella melzeri]|nr:hypothetical protein BC835DRAFT_1305425 [Cytidiella melzeri]